MTDPILYPECEKLLKVKAQQEIIHDFIEWCGSNGMEICKWGSGDYYAVSLDKSIEHLLADYFEIDLSKVEQERKMILDHLEKKKCL